MMEISTVAFPLTVLLASLAGSWHCAAMCGGLITVAAPSAGAAWFYHFGRLLGYGALGSAAGIFGRNVLNSSWTPLLSWSATFILGLGFIFLGILSWSGPPDLKMPPGFLKFYRMGGARLLDSRRSFSSKAFSAGLLSILLPCGWLYTFVLAATAMQSPWKGAMVLGAFWAGTLPALSAAPLLVRKILEPIQRRLPKLAATLLIGLGLFTLGMKMSALAPSSFSPGRPSLICHTPSQAPLFQTEAQPPPP